MSVLSAPACNPVSVGERGNINGTPTGQPNRCLQLGNRWLQHAGLFVRLSQNQMRGDEIRVHLEGTPVEVNGLIVFASEEVARSDPSVNDARQRIEFTRALGFRDRLVVPPH